jgi:hypothetical protein
LAGAGDAVPARVRRRRAAVPGTRAPAARPRLSCRATPGSAQAALPRGHETHLPCSCSEHGGGAHAPPRKSSRVDFQLKGPLNASRHFLTGGVLHRTRAVCCRANHPRRADPHRPSSRSRETTKNHFQPCAKLQLTHAEPAVSTGCVPSQNGDLISALQRRMAAKQRRSSTAAAGSSPSPSPSFAEVNHYVGACLAGALLPPTVGLRRGAATAAPARIYDVRSRIQVISEPEIAPFARPVVGRNAPG